MRLYAWKNYLRSTFHGHTDPWNDDARYLVLCKSCKRSTRKVLRDFTKKMHFHIVSSISYLRWSWKQMRLTLRIWSSINPHKILGDINVVGRTTLSIASELKMLDWEDSEWMESSWIIELNIHHCRKWLRDGKAFNLFGFWRNIRQ